jgi:tetratricopeptide (TPR) repeat protein
MTTNDERNLLSPLAAAHHLGITTELLFQYTKKTFGKGSGLRSLATVQDSGKTKFSISELDAFDRLLAEPWCNAGDSRPDIPKAIVDHLRAESFNQCSRCANGVGVETAHIIPWAACRAHHHANLIRICTSCHSEHDDQHSLPTEELIALKNSLVKRTRANLTARMSPTHVLRSLPRAATRFVGRERELSSLIDALQSGRSVLVTGVGGIGKTELLVQALGRLEPGRQIFWIDTERHRSSSDIVAALQAALADNGIACPEAEIPARLDALQACVVFDGIERATLDDIDEFEDALAELYSATSTAQFVATSQVVLHRLAAEARFEVGKLDEKSSRLLLENSSSLGGSNGQEDLGPLVDFCEGHALTIKLASALMDHYGGPSAALRAVESKGAAAVSLPGRKRQSRATSLELCLDTAYEALPAEAIQLFWALSESPAGILTNLLEIRWCELSDPIEALAELRRWHLVEVIPISGGLGQTHVLGPIRSFAAQRGRRDDPRGYEALLDRLVQAHGMIVAVLELNYDDPNETPYVLKRYGDELPNLLHTLDLARANQANARMVETAVSIVRALMRYFFVMRLLDQGARAMRDAAELALSAGHLECASALSLQLVALAQRAENSEGASLIRAGLALANQIEALTDDEKTLADIAMCRGIAARETGDYSTAENYARKAIVRFRSRLRSSTAWKSRNQQSDGSEPPVSHDLYNDLSNSLFLLGFVLLSLGRYQEAAKAYRYSLRYQRGASVAVNRGQALHQLGNCESHLGRFRHAASNYLQAAVIFDFAGMREYLGNALGELGYTLLDTETDIPDEGLSPELIERGLIDLAMDTKRIFDPARPLDHSKCVGAIRKLFGSIALVSLVGSGRQLGQFCLSLCNEVLVVFHEEFSNERRDPEEGFPLAMIDTALRLGFLACEAEQSLEQLGEIPRETIDVMLRTICDSHDWAQNTMRLIDWFGLLLTRRWGFQGGSPERLHGFIKNLNDDVVDYLELTREDRSR